MIFKSQVLIAKRLILPKIFREALNPEPLSVGSSGYFLINRSGGI